MASRTNHVDPFMYRPFIKAGLKLESATMTLEAGDVLDEAVPPVLFVDADEAIDVVLPEPSEENRGLTFFITNVGGVNAITFQEPADTDIQAVAAGESYMLHCDGTEWRVLMAGA